MSADVDEAQHARMHNPEQLEFGKRQRRNSRSPPGGSDATVDDNEAAKNAVLTMRTSYFEPIPGAGNS